MMDLSEIFFPQAVTELITMKESGNKLVHYTSAENAFKIFDSEKFWMRNAKCMNDINEIEHGLKSINELLFEEDNALLTSIKDIGLFTDNQIREQFYKAAKVAKSNCFVTSFSSHPKYEDEFGRLSMWRAYGSKTSNVALVLNPIPFYSETNVLSVYASPVTYGDTSVLMEIGEKIAHNIQANLTLLKNIDKEKLENVIFRMFLFGITCFKHSAFKEEQEWRVIHIPNFESSEHIKQTEVCLGGVPQSIFEIPLCDFPNTEFVGTSLEVLIHEVLIGPSEFPEVVRDALISKLVAKSVSRANERVRITNIPLRL